MILFKPLKKILSIIIIFILIAVIFQFVVNVKYKFPEPHPFKGEYIYNPYRNFDGTKWKIANFHAHSGKFLESAGKINRSIQYLDSLYKYFGYCIIGISDYQSISFFESKIESYVPVYEHGYQYYKNHQLVINTQKVNWFDFPFRQTLSNKQFIINQLKKDTGSYLAIVHPKYREAYSFRDFKYLSNYDFLEIANHKHLFTEYYDTILSNGHPVFILADDDSHDLTDIKDICSSFNLVNSELKKDSILYALNTGRSVGVKFNISTYKTNREKRVALLNLPQISSIGIKNDTITLNLNKKVKTIRFIGQQGITKKIISDCSSGSFYFSKQDTYIRTEIECNDGTLYFLNPYFRFNGIILSDYAPSINALKTWSWRLAIFVILILTLIIWKYKSKCIKTKK